MKKMLTSTRLEIIKKLQKLKTNSITHEDIKSVLISLREYCRSDSTFSEIADFVAHSHIRDRGTIKDFIVEYEMQNLYDAKYREKLENIEVFPKWLIKLLKSRSKLHEQTLATMHNISNSEMQRLFKTEFTNAPGSSDWKPTKKLDNSKLYAIRTIMQYWNSDILYEHQIINSFKNALIANNFKNEADLVEEYSEEIICCVLVILHKSQFMIREGEYGSVEIRPNAEMFPVDDFIFAPNNQGVVYERSLPNLSAVASIDAKAFLPDEFAALVGDKPFTYSFTLLRTSVPALRRFGDDIININQPEPDQRFPRQKSMLVLVGTPEEVIFDGVKIKDIKSAI